MLPNSLLRWLSRGGFTECCHAVWVSPDRSLWADFDVSSMIERGTSRRAAGTALWSFGLEPAGAVSPHPGDDPWC